MAYWLASKREGQDSDTIQRFDPRFWTVDFPRPTMASVVNNGAANLRVDCEFHHRDALIGLIWESRDRYDHPLLAYDTDRDYSRTTLSFRWLSQNVLPLDAVHGPTLTIEGSDAAGNPRSWYVRLWRYASGTPTDAQVTLPFSELREGWLADGDPVNPAGIDRMFISILPPLYDPEDNSLLPQRVDGAVNLLNLNAAGERATLTIGDVLLPPHGTGMATAYDDSYNLVPSRLVRNVRHLGYTGPLIHYVGMSHYYRLLRQSDDSLLADPAGVLCLPARRWHDYFFHRCKELGLLPIVSLSYELFDEHCPPGWKQRTADGTPARTGWEPPSTLLSPANAEAMTFLKAVAARFVLSIKQRGLPVSFQIGEPWWWVMPDSRAPCLYDDAARAALGARVASVPEIADMRAVASETERALLDAAGAILAESTAALAQAVRTEAGGVAEVMLLTFTPTILDPEMPELRRANLPVGWAYPAYDRLQLEDYDWLTAGAEALRRRAYAEVAERLGYPLELQDYLAGFVLDPDDAEPFWKRIDAGLDEAIARGVARTFVWASPQVARDGYVRLP